MKTPAEHLIDILNLALKRNGLSSDRKLAPVMALSPASISAWRKGHALPDDDSMARLADLAGLDKREALLQLNIWRCDGPAREMYENMLAGLKKVVAVLLMALFCFSSSPSQAGLEHNVHIAQPGFQKYTLSLLKRAFMRAVLWLKNLALTAL